MVMASASVRHHAPAEGRSRARAALQATAQPNAIPGVVAAPDQKRSSNETWASGNWYESAAAASSVVPSSANQRVSPAFSPEAPRAIQNIQPKGSRPRTAMPPAHMAAARPNAR
jgi:hypothetical protein